MIDVRFNGQPIAVSNIEELGSELDRFDREPEFELWCRVAAGPAIGMLRNGEHGWLMYLRYPGDAGFRSEGESDLKGNSTYTLSNGQVDEYPLSWCIDLEDCYKAVAFFFVNDGERPDWIKWRE